MRYVVYNAVFDDSENRPKVFSIRFPDVPNALTYGTGQGEAMARASEVLGAMLFDKAEKELPKATSLAKIKAENRGKLVIPIVADLKRARLETRPVKVKKNTTIPGDLAAQAEAAGINLSATLTEALRKKLNS